MTWNSRLTEKEDYVSFEIAKLLYDKGFKDLTYFSYDSLGIIVVSYWEWIEGTYPRCTLQMAMKWLREVYNLFVDIYYDYDFGEGYRFSVHKLPKGTTLETHDENYSTYEQACEEAIKYILENLIINENPAK